VPDDGGKEADFGFVPMKNIRNAMYQKEKGSGLCFECYSTDYLGPSINCLLKGIYAKLFMIPGFSAIWCRMCFIKKKGACDGKDCKKTVQRLALFRAIREGNCYTKMEKVYNASNGRGTYLNGEGPVASNLHLEQKHIEWVFKNWDAFSKALTTVNVDIFS